MFLVTFISLFCTFSLFAKMLMQGLIDNKVKVYFYVLGVDFEELKFFYCEWSDRYLKVLLGIYDVLFRYGEFKLVQVIGWVCKVVLKKGQFLCFSVMFDYEVGWVKVKLISQEIDIKDKMKVLIYKSGADVEEDKLFGYFWVSGEMMLLAGKFDLCLVE